MIDTMLAITWTPNVHSLAPCLRLVVTITSYELRDDPGYETFTL